MDAISTLALQAMLADCLGRAAAAMAFVREALLPFADGLERDGHDLVEDLAGDREAFRAAIAGLGTLTDIQWRLQTGSPRQ